MGIVEIIGIGSAALSIALLLGVLYALRRVYLIVHRRQFLGMEGIAPQHEPAFYRFPSKAH